ncbi:MAG: hypothetical protein Q8859_11800, partial [Bacteroidota bacterium]|nr:hypothetical protein [Bacteroidota bacterium]
MKQRLFFLAMTMFLFVATAFAQTYDADMDVLLSGLESKNSNLTMLSSQFESLQQSDPSRWEASYYFVFSKILIAMNEKNGENIDRLLDDAQSVLTKLIAGHPKESEFQVLQGWLYQARISVSPMSRGMEYTQKANASFANAITLDE